MRSIIDVGVDLKIVGVVQANPDSTITSLSPGINYTPELVSYIIDEAADREVVRVQIEIPA